MGDEQTCLSKLIAVDETENFGILFFCSFQCSAKQKSLTANIHKDTCD